MESLLGLRHEMRDGWPGFQWLQLIKSAGQARAMACKGKIKYIDYKICGPFWGVAMQNVAETVTQAQIHPCRVISRMRLLIKNQS